MGIESNGYSLFETRDTAVGSSHTNVGIIERKPSVRNCLDKPKTQHISDLPQSGLVQCSFVPTTPS
jgi:hypothetical protein